MNYGKQGLDLNIPNEWDVEVIRKRPMPVLFDPVDDIHRALSGPIGCNTLTEEARGCKTACIAICDITRPVPNGLILPILVRELLDAGIDASNITILVATGLHRPNEGHELKELIGDGWVQETVHVVNHFARNDADHLDLGLTKRGTPVKIDRRFVEADLRIVVGLVEPHFMAGYSGGRKLVTPGVAHQDTIRTLHNADILSHTNCTNCQLACNPLHDEQIEIIGKLGKVLAVNVVIDEERRVSFVNFGHVEASHDQAVDFIRDYAEVKIPERFSIIVTSAAGYPLDKTFYQTVKGMVGALGILKPGGDLFIVSECSEGMGSPEYTAAQRSLALMGSENFMELQKTKKFADIDEWQTVMMLKATQMASVHLYSEALPDDVNPLLCVNRVESLAEAIETSVEKHGPRIAVIPEGPYVIPLYSEE